MFFILLNEFLINFKGIDKILLGNLFNRIKNSCVKVNVYKKILLWKIIYIIYEYY